MLHKLQTSFLKGLYDASVGEEACLYLNETDKTTATQQLSIYRGSVYGGLKKALAETFPITKRLVGNDFFNAMLGQYIKTYPCRVQDLNGYGKELPEFIKNLKQARSIPYLTDVAQLEWHCNIVLNASLQKNNLFELSLLNSEQQSKLKLKLPNTSVLFQCRYPVDEIWAMHQEASEKELNITEQLVNLFVWKSEFGIKVEKLTEEQFYFLDQLSKGYAFVNVCDAVVRKFLQADINALFSQSLQYGWLQSYEI